MYGLLRNISGELTGRLLRIRVRVPGMKALLVVAGFSALGAHATTDYTLFESGQVRPLAISATNDFLYAVNTPDNRLEVLRLTGSGPQLVGSVSVGLEPVAVAVAPNGTVWVVNHLSDSVSVVDVSNPKRPFLKHTLHVGDEPRDIVFAGYGRDKAFVTTASRGQHHPQPASLIEPGVGRADVWVFDSHHIHLSQQPTTIVRLFTDTPRALAVSPDGTKVYAAGFLTGNQTTTIFEELIPNGGEAFGGLPSVRTDAAGEEQPETGLIVRYNGEHWVDELGRSWDHRVKFSLPDKDVFVIDASATVPALLETNGEIRGVGTVLYNMAVNPVSGKVYVSNTEALNEHRFEGHGERLGREYTVQGHFYENRITVIDGTTPVIRHLNKHIDYSECCAPAPNSESETSLALPMDMTVSPDGKQLYVAAFGSSKLGIFDTEALEKNTFVPSQSAQVELTGGGPSGVVFDSKRQRLYAMTRFDNGISTVDVSTRQEIKHLTLFSPEPATIVEGRRFLYDARFTSSHGDSACGSCHVFGDLDSLAWDLGNPDEVSFTNPGPFVLGPSVIQPDGSVFTGNPDFRALKGPMTTQSLRGMANHGPMHWRGDRTGGNEEASAQPDSGAFSERAAFGKFNVAFVGLIGRDQMLTDEELAKFTDFALAIMYPPNPVRHLDNSLTPEQAAGRDIFFGDVSDGAFNCNGCHVLDRDANREFDIDKPGFFGTDGRYALVPEPQFMKVPQLRNMYQKVGMFGMDQIESGIPSDTSHMGDQVRGFGFFHDGSVDTMFRFHGGTIFSARPAGALGPFDPGNPGGFPFLPAEDPDAEFMNEIGEIMRRQVEAFTFVFDTNLLPIVGQQATINAFSSNTDIELATLMISRADAGDCDLVGRWWNGLREIGVLYSNGEFIVDRSDIAPVTLESMEHLAAKIRNWGGSRSLTLTCTPPGSGVRVALDRNRDGIRDGDALSLGEKSAANNIFLN